MEAGEMSDFDRVRKAAVTMALLDEKRQVVQAAMAGETLFVFDEATAERDRLIWSVGYTYGLKTLSKWLSDPEGWVDDAEDEALASSLVLLQTAVQYYRKAIGEYGSFDAALAAHRADALAVDWEQLFEPMQKANILGELFGLSFEQIDEVAVLLTDGWSDTYERLVEVVRKLST